MGWGEWGLGFLVGGMGLNGSGGGGVSSKQKDLLYIFCSMLTQSYYSFFRETNEGGGRYFQIYMV